MKPVKTKTIAVESPHLVDIDELLKLYFIIYGKDYPIVYGTDPKAMSETIASENHLWLIARDQGSGKIAGSIVYELDRISRLGKATALVVHPDYRNQRIGHLLVEHGTDLLLAGPERLHSLYTTTRTLSMGPQLVFLGNGYVPLGIFPNAHRLRQMETTTLMAKFHPESLARRDPSAGIPKKLGPIYEALHQTLGKSLGEILGTAKIPDLLDPTAPVKLEAGEETEFELIFAPEFVRRRFYEVFSDPYDRFFPFHLPNLLIVDKSGEVEIFAHFSKPDAYCTIVANTRPFFELAGKTRSLMRRARDYGISYLEVLIGAEHTRSIETLLNAQFLPSAVYPAMRESQGRMQDFIIMSRSMEPLDFRGMAIEQRFKPYVDQYVDLWKQMHLDTLEVFNDYR